MILETRRAVTVTVRVRRYALDTLTVQDCHASDQRSGTPIERVSMPSEAQRQLLVVEPWRRNAVPP